MTKYSGSPNSPMKTILPSNVHITLQKEQLKNKVIIIGDVHGCFEELNELLTECEYNENNCSVIFVGDLVNKGPYSVEVVQFARKIKAHVVRGNHDDYALAIAQNLISRPIESEGLNYISKFSPEDLNWLNELPYTITIPSLDAIIVHAGLLPEIDLNKQTISDMYTIRNIIKNEDGSLSGTSNIKLGEPWVNYWNHSPHIYFGHGN